jgi:hypothetical protein
MNMWWVHFTTPITVEAECFNEVKESPNYSEKAVSALLIAWHVEVRR